MKRPGLVLGAGAMVSLWALCCIPEEKPAGDEVLGTFQFSGTVLDQDCPFSEFSADAGLQFGATLSRESAGSPVWLTVGGIAREATLDGQRFASSHRVPRHFSACDCEAELEETLDVVLLSRSQNDALQGLCPVDALDGGIPAPDADAGIVAPAPGRRGYDAVRACGTLRDVVVPAEGCLCGPCRLEYRIVGVKQ